MTDDLLRDKIKHELAGEWVWDLVPVSEVAEVAARMAEEHYRPLLDHRVHLQNVVRELHRRCERVAKITDDAFAYELLNDVMWKVERALRDGGAG